jgi:hypothetical protein
LFAGRLFAPKPIGVTELPSGGRALSAKGTGVIGTDNFIQRMPMSSRAVQLSVPVYPPHWDVADVGTAVD